MGIDATVFVHESSYIDDNVTIGADSKIWHFSHILSNTVIGNKCSLGQNVVVGPNVKIGNCVKIQNNVSIYDGIELEDDVFCGPSCVFTNVHNPRAKIVRRNEFRKTKVRQGATIGANATIICGIVLGKYCFIGAGATVTKDVPDYALMTGVPAKQIGWMSEAGGRLNANLNCPMTSQQYQLNSNNTLEKIQ